jgi:hypothetical protein
MAIAVPALIAAAFAPLPMAMLFVEAATELKPTATLL